MAPVTPKNEPFINFAKPSPGEVRATTLAIGEESGSAGFAVVQAPGTAPAIEDLRTTNLPATEMLKKIKEILSADPYLPKIVSASKIDDLSHRLLAAGFKGEDAGMVIKTFCDEQRGR